MTTLIRTLACGVALFAVTSIQPAFAQLEIGTWVRRPIPGMPDMTMTIEACCNGGRRLSYHFMAGKTDMLMTIETRLDGTDTPVLVDGKPTPGTMAIKRTDEHHASTVIKTNGAVMGTSTATLSADGKTLTVVNEYASSAGGQQVGKVTEIWDRK